MEKKLTAKESMQIMGGIAETNGNLIDPCSISTNRRQRDS